MLIAFLMIAGLISISIVVSLWCCLVVAKQADQDYEGPHMMKKKE